jgi:putative intracellular protease/amidase
MRIFLYVLETLADWEISYILPELNSGRFIFNKSKTFDIVKISNSLNPIRTMGGLVIEPEETIFNVTFNKDDILILPGADTWMEPQNYDVMKNVDKLLQNGVTICAICGSTVAMADSGMLDERKHTSNDKEYLKMFCKNYKGSDNYLNEPVVVAENLITASGLAPLEFSLEVLKSTKLFKNNTLDSWYNLNKTRESKYFFELIGSLKY